MLLQNKDGVAIHPQYFVNRLNKLAADDAIFTFDVAPLLSGLHAILKRMANVVSLAPTTMVPWPMQ